MTRFIVRPATQADIDDVVRLSHGLFLEDSGVRDPTTNTDWPLREGHAYFSSFINDGQSLLLVTGSSGEVNGYLAGRLRAATSFRPIVVAELESVFVAPANRGSGIGTALTAAFFSWAEASGADRTQVTAHAENAAAIRLYERVGFRPYHLTLQRTLVAHAFG
jgi:ribosomal protein S18 acetylase RimI-like enzyme